MIYDRRLGSGGEQLPLGAAEPEPRYPFEILHVSLHDLFEPAVTDAEGRFRIDGVGRERIITLSISGPSVPTHLIEVATRPGRGVRRFEKLGDFPSASTVLARYDAASFVHLVPKTGPEGRPRAGADDGSDAAERPYLRPSGLRIRTVFVDIVGADSASLAEPAVRDRVLRTTEELVKAVERSTSLRVVDSPDEADVILRATLTRRALVLDEGPPPDPD